MKKKVLSAVLALTLVFGSAASLPSGVLTDSTSITASAVGESGVSQSFKYTVLDDGTVQITGYNGSSTTVSIPSTLVGKTVTSIGSSAFTLNTTITKVSIPDTVTTISTYAFLGCRNLTSVQIGKNVTKIGASAFSQAKLKSVTIPGAVTSLGANAFENCEYLETVTFEKGSSKAIDNAAFSGCKSLKTVNFANCISAIGSFAFKDCRALTSVTIPDTVQAIYQSSFESCSSLTTLDLGDGIKSISSKAFRNCAKLNSVTFGAQLRIIGDYAFENCIDLEKIELMPSTAEIGVGAFDGCEGLTTALLPGVEVIGNKAFAYCSKLANVGLGEDLRAVGQEAFLNCPAYKHAYIPGSVEQIGTYAFGYGFNGTSYGKLKNFSIHGEKNSEAYRYAGAKTTFVEVGAHTHSGSSIVVPPTCLNEGCTVQICKVCGHLSHSNTVKAKGHSGSNWRTTAYNTKTNTSSQEGICSVCGDTTKKTTTNAITRLSGADRYATAVAISQAEHKNEANTVILANSSSYADALAGVPLAQKLQAPILLTSKDSLHKNTLAEIKRLGAKNVFILGGTGAVSDKVVTALTKNGISAKNIKRLAGGTRFGTATAIAEYLNADTVASEVFFVYSNSFADALSIGSVAARKHAPILYLTTEGKMNAETAVYLKKIMGKVKKAYVIGGDKIISEQMRKQVASYSLLQDSSVIRVAGKNRYETCIAVNKQFSSTLSSSGVCIAKGLDFPDALAGGVYAALKSMPLFLADGKTLSNSQKAYLKTKNPATLTAFGGKGAVSDELVSLIAKASV